MAAEKPKIVVSAVNLTEAGPLSILRDCLDYAAAHLADRFEIVALVHSAALVGARNITLIEYPASKRSWMLRLYYEYFGFRTLSQRLAPHLWLSLHDMTPNVTAERRAVYCHNPSPFHRLRAKEAYLDPRFALFAWLYGGLYAINLTRNRFVIVQQEWLRREFCARHRLSNVVVAHPTVPTPSARVGAPARRRDSPAVFFYPAFPRVFKNFEVIGEAATRLRQAGVRNFEICLTTDGRENRYARHVAPLLRAVPEIRMLGRQSRESVFELYGRTDCLLFPSRLETWGLPITEFRATGKPMLVADCRYAAETVGDYGNVAYFDPDDAGHLSALMRAVIEDRFQPEPRAVRTPAEPYARDWAGLFEILLNDPPCPA